MKLYALVAGIGFAILLPDAHADTETGFAFTHKDWGLACDNTRTCRVEGYQSDDDEVFVSVLLTRVAGPGQPVTGEFEIDIDDELLNTLPASFTLTMSINGKNISRVSMDRETLHSDLTEAQVRALLGSLTHDSVIAWTLGQHTWRLSDQGAAAVLLKMDDYQGRIGTPGAIVHPGAQSESKVLPPLPKPVVVAATAIDAESGYDTFSASNSKKVMSVLIRSQRNDDCFADPSDSVSDSLLAAARLDDRKLLVSTLCWRAAYNEGFGYWVINKSPPYEPVLVTSSGSSYSKGVISSSQKGRGLGDCWASDTWTWDGSRFVLTESATTGMCKGRPGGAWLLPTVTSDVRQP